MPGPTEISESKQLVVEGRDAEAFFRALLDHMGVTGVQAQNFGGVRELPGFLRALRNAPGFAQVISLGIVRDAETDAEAAFRSVCSALNGASLAVPTQAMVPTGHSPQVNVLILPDGTRPGMLETICLQAVGDDPVIECIDQYFECVGRRVGSLPGNIHKARAQAFLASRHRAGLRLGEAALAGYWHLGSPAFDHVRRFVQAL